MLRQAHRKAEYPLLFFVTLLLLSGLTLVFLARMRLGVPSNAININTTTSDQLALAFKIDPSLTRRIIAEREKTGGFDSVNQIRAIPLFSATECMVIDSILRANKIDWKIAPPTVIRQALSLSMPVTNQLLSERNSIPPQADISRVKLLTPSQWIMMRNRLYVRTPFQVFWSFLFASILLLCMPYVVLAIHNRFNMAGDPFLLPLTWFLSGLGVIFIFSVKDPFRDSPAYLHQVITLCIALILLMFFSLISTPARRRMRRYVNWWGIGFLVCGVLMKVLDGKTFGGGIVIHHFHPAYLYFLLFTLFFVSYLSSHPDLYSEAIRRWRSPNRVVKNRLVTSSFRFQREDITPALLGAGCILFTYVTMCDIVSTAIICILFASIYYLATGRSGMLSLGIAFLFLLGVTGFLMHVGDMHARCEMWFHPWSNTYGNGSQLGQGYWALSSGGVYGTGLGMGMPEKIPLVSTDMMFAAIGEELGLFGALVILCLFEFIIQRGLRMAMHIQNDFDRILAGGLSVLLFISVLSITAGVTGLFPLAGLNLPFVTYGASALFPNFIIIGLLLGLSVKSAYPSSEDSHPAIREIHWKYKLAVWISLIGVIGIGRLCWIQFIRADWYATRKISTPDADGIVRAKTNPRILSVQNRIPRGSIYDRYGRVLATSHLDEIVMSLGDDLTSGIIYYRRGRYYPGGGAMVFPVGCIRTAFTPSSGAEKRYDQALRGYNQDEDLIRIYRRQNLPTWFFGLVPAGKNVTLTLDAALQERSVEILRRELGSLPAIRKGSLPKAALVMMDPSTGEIVVSCSLPGYDPNRLLALSDNWRSNHTGPMSAILHSLHYGPDQTRLAQFEPGNAFEPFIASAALQKGINPKFQCNHTLSDLKWSSNGVSYYLRSISDIAGAPPHGLIGLQRALSVSCRVYFAQLSVKLGAKEMRQILASPQGFGFEHLPPDNRFVSNLPLTANGVGLTRVSPLEMADAIAAIANHGERMKPILLKSISRSGQKPYLTNPYVPLSTPLNPREAIRMGDMLRVAEREEVEALGLRPSGYHIAAKIATVEGVNGERWTWYVGFAPQRKPILAFACIVQGGGESARKAVIQSMRQILQERFGK